MLRFPTSPKSRTLDEVRSGAALVLLGTGFLHEIATADIASRHEIVWGDGKVERLGTVFDIDAFLDRELAENAGVEIDDFGRTHRVAASSAETDLTAGHKCGRLLEGVAVNVAEYHDLGLGLAVGLSIARWRLEKTHSHQLRACDYASRGSRAPRFVRGVHKEISARAHDTFAT